jgi:hypothetical protein
VSLRRTAALLFAGAGGGACCFAIKLYRVLRPACWPFLVFGIIFLILSGVAARLPERGRPQPPPLARSLVLEGPLLALAAFTGAALAAAYFARARG